MKKLNFSWLRAAGIRAAKTMAQTALGMFTIGAACNEVNWVQVGSVAVVAGVYSLLTSVATGLPEVQPNSALTTASSDSSTKSV